MEQTMMQFTLERTGQKDIRFKGMMIAEAKQDSMFGHIQRRIYKTIGGKFVVETVNQNHLVSQSTKALSVYDTEEAMVAAIGASSLTRELFKQAGLDYVEDIE